LHPTVWWRRREVGTSREKIRSEGGSFRSGATGCGGQDTGECKREREKHKMEPPLTELEQLTLDEHTAWYLYPQARARAIPAYYKYGPSTNGQVNMVIRCPYSTLSGMADCVAPQTPTSDRKFSVPRWLAAVPPRLCDLEVSYHLSQLLQS
jgi:hypothetical protein